MCAAIIFLDSFLKLAWIHEPTPTWSMVSKIMICHHLIWFFRVVVLNIPYPSPLNPRLPWRIYTIIHSIMLVKLLPGATCLPFENHCLVTFSSTCLLSFYEVLLYHNEYLSLFKALLLTSASKYAVHCLLYCHHLRPSVWSANKMYHFYIDMLVIIVHIKKTLTNMTFRCCLQLCSSICVYLVIKV